MATTTPTKTHVKMIDGRTVEFGAKQRIIKTLTKVDGVCSVQLDFVNGETRTYMFDETDPLLFQLALHGASQKIGDSASGIEDLDDAVAAVDATIAQLQAGNWTAERAAGSGFGGASIVVRAVAEVTGKTPAEVSKIIEAKLATYAAQGKPITRQALYATFRAPGTKTAAVIARLTAERDAKKTAKLGAVTADDLLGEIINDTPDEATGE